MHMALLAARLAVLIRNARIMATDRQTGQEVTLQPAPSLLSAREWDYSKWYKYSVRVSLESSFRSFLYLASLARSRRQATSPPPLDEKREKEGKWVIFPWKTPEKQHRKCVTQYVRCRDIHMRQENGGIEWSNRGTIFSSCDNKFPIFYSTLEWRWWWRGNREGEQEGCGPGGNVSTLGTWLVVWQRCVCPELQIKRRYTHFKFFCF